jgi:TonB family protein
MKKIISIFFVLFCSCSWNYAQTFVSGIYEINNFDTTLSCYIEFYADERYQLILEEHVTNDMVESTILSYGRFNIKKDVIILFDAVHGFEMEFYISKTKQIIVTKGFIFLMRKVLTFDQDIYTKCMKPEINPEKQQRSRAEYLRLHSTLYTFHYGQYGSVSAYQLDLKRDKQYTLFYKDILISEGTWKRQGNEIILFDTHLQHSFYVLVGKDRLISCYLPGDFYGLSLYRINPSDRTIFTQKAANVAFPLIIEEKTNSNDTFMFVEEMPEFPQGAKAMLRFIKENTHYPEADRKAGIKGRVVLDFVIEKDGTISTVEVQKKLSPLCDEEAIRVVKSMPKWIPGKQNGVKVAVKYTIAVNFGIK